NQQKPKPYWLLLLVPLLALGVLAYRKLRKPKEEITIESSAVVEKEFDYNAEARKLLMKSKRMFERGEYKEAYALAAQALRLYLSYKHDLKKELTNYEVIEFLKKQKLPYKEAKECFDLCTLVEFAKYKPKKEDYNRIVSIVEAFLGP
ncbi:hypothetical protein DRJ48_04560, partial [Candidatus Woesearchaeota archaeon]